MISQHGGADTPQRPEWSERQTVHSPVVPAQKARQGAIGYNVRYVLDFGIAAAIIVFFAIGSPISPDAATLPNAAGSPSAVDGLA